LVFWVFVGWLFLSLFFFFFFGGNPDPLEMHCTKVMNMSGIL